jgi:hypothetical protein
MENQIEVRDYNELSRSIGLAQYTVYKKYLSDLSRFPVVMLSQVFLDESPENCIRLVKLEKLIQKKGEDVFQKLTTVYHASMSLGCNLVVMVDVASTNAPADIYIGVKNAGFEAKEKVDLTTSFETLKNGLKSNFPGTAFKSIPSKEVLPKVIDEIFGDTAKYISSASCIASRRDKTKTEDKDFVQGIERLIDAMQGNTYTAIFIARPITVEEQSLIRDGYESIYSSLSAFRKSTWSYSSNESDAVMESLSKGISKSITTGTTHTQTHGTNIGMNIGLNSSKSTENSQSHAETRPTDLGIAGQTLSGVGKVVGLLGEFVPMVGGPLQIVGGAMKIVGDTAKEFAEGHSISDTIASSIGKSLGVSGEVSAGASNSSSYSVMKSETKSNTETNTEGRTTTKGTGKTLQIENINKPIDDMLVRIDDLLKRAKECEDYGAYNCAVYFISGKQSSCMLGANTFRALMIGEGSSLETGAINFWNGEKGDDADKVATIKEYLKRFEHPLFAMPISETLNSDEDFVKYTPGTIVSGLELPLHMGLPSKSVYGLPVIEHAEFGREVVKYNAEENKQEFEIGDIFSMGTTTNTKAKLDINSLAMHTFITGTTGSGKSNTVYWILEQLVKENKKFLVIEPAKGEYKKMVGQNDNVTVYGTNPLKNDSELLRINPFSFPVGEIHILEHLDRLVEIFNVCWPMYAAMPAILKDAIERAYVCAGWDLIKSENKYSNELCPTFKDLMIQIKQVLDESEYSNDNKGDYTGALVTRIKSLTNGINGLIFQSDEIAPSKLFDENVVVDLSRVGSSETKSLIMGILVLKLQEHRMMNAKPDSDLTHVTVLEEAHNLLRRTSTEQSSESSNLLGKSVEMLSNAIAEMRTYGEGFIIADQSPGLLDMSVIRNTNTKIIMRLPDFSDRELVGKAAGLNDNQVVECARLEKGVAAITQSDWVEPVLCKIGLYKDSNMNNIVEKSKAIYSVEDNGTIKLKVLDYIINREVHRKIDQLDLLNLKDLIVRSSLDSVVKCKLIDYMESNKDISPDSLQSIIYSFFNMDEAVVKVKSSKDIFDWVNGLVAELNPDIKVYNNTQINRLLALLINEQATRNVEYMDIFNAFSEVYRKRGKVFDGRVW